MRQLALVLGISVLCITVAQADQIDSSTSAERVRLALQNPTIGSPLWLPPDRKLGVLTLLPPDRQGEIIRFSLPIGDLANRSVRAIGKAQRRRAERKAREEVQRALKEFAAKETVAPPESD